MLVLQSLNQLSLRQQRLDGRGSRRHSTRICIARIGRGLLHRCRCVDEQEHLGGTKGLCLCPRVRIEGNDGKADQHREPQSQQKETPPAMHLPRITRDEQERDNRCERQHAEQHPLLNGERPIKLKGGRGGR